MSTSKDRVGVPSVALHQGPCFLVFGAFIVLRRSLHSSITHKLNVSF